MKKLIFTMMTLCLMAMISLGVRAETYRPPTTENTDKGHKTTHWHGPRHYINQDEFTCPGPPDTKCIIVYTPLYIIGNPIGIGTRIHIWFNLEENPMGITNAILTSPWDSNSGIDPSYTTDSQSQNVFDINQWENTPFVQ